MSELPPAQLTTADFYATLPKVDLHRHLEGSIRLSTLVQLRRKFGLQLANTGSLGPLVQIHPDDPLTFSNFLSKFQYLRLFYRSPDIIDRITREAIADAAADRIRYLELRFTPAALSRAENFPLAEVMDWVVEAAQAASEQFQIKTRLIASVNRQESPKLAEQVAGLACDRRERGIVGLDLAGNEAQFSALPFAGIFQEAQKSGLHSTVHAGEWGGANNIQEAILQLGAERIGHGIRALDDPDVVSLLKERRTPLEVCVHSNFHSGVIPVSQPHPLPQLLAQGIYTTLNTDDPSISQITLSQEYQYAHKTLALPIGELHKLIRNAALAAFLPASEKYQLLQELQSELSPA